MKTTLERLKNSETDAIRIEEDFHCRAYERLQTALFRKFLGKALPLEQVSEALSKLWSKYGSFTIADMVNGFYFIKCDSVQMSEKLLWDRP